MAETTLESEGGSSSGGIVCPSCGAVSPAGQRFCGECGGKLPAPESVPVASAAPPPVVSVVAVPVVEAPVTPTVATAPPVVPPPVSAPVASPTPVAPPPPALPDVARERERDRLLTLANVQRMRGQTVEAAKTLETVMSLSEGRSDREMAPVQELRGDLLSAAGKWEEALAAFEMAHNLDTERVSAEKKFAETTLRIAEAKAIASGSMLGMGDSFGSGAFGGGDRGKRNPGLAMLLSFLIPGFGQLFSGELVKASICVGVYLLSLLAIGLMKGYEVLFAKVMVMFAPASPQAEHASDPLSPLVVLLLIIAGLDWLYSMGDAAMSASKTADGGPKGAAPPAGDRSGWEP